MVTRSRDDNNQLLITSNYADKSSFTKMKVSDGLMFQIVICDTYARGKELELTNLFVSRGIARNISKP